MNAQVNEKLKSMTILTQVVADAVMADGYQREAAGLITKHMNEEAKDGFADWTLTEVRWPSSGEQPPDQFLISSEAQEWSKIDLTAETIDSYYEDEITFISPFNAMKVAMAANDLKLRKQTTWMAMAIETNYGIGYQLSVEADRNWI